MTPWTVAPQVPLCMGFPRQEYWSEFPFPSPGDRPDPGVKPLSPASASDSLPLSHLGSPTSASEMPSNSLNIESERVKEVYLKFKIFLPIYYTSMNWTLLKKKKMKDQNLNAFLPKSLHGLTNNFITSFSVISDLDTSKVMGREPLLGQRNVQAQSFLTTH